MKNQAKIDSFYDLTTTFHDDQSCREYLEELRWNGKPACPHCGHDEKIYRFKDGKKFKCGDCRKQFTITVGTVFEGSHIDLKKWFWAIYLFSSHKKGISSIQLGKDIKVQQRSAWFMLQRIRSMMGNEEFWKPLEGQVEVDETFVGGKEKNKHFDKKLEGVQGRSTKGKSVVLGMKQRGGDVKAMKVNDASSESLHPVIRENIKEGSHLITDEWRGYKGLEHIYQHNTISHSTGEYVRGTFHTNNIENFWSMLKRGILGIYHHTSPKHLTRYVDEFAFRYNSRNLGESSRFNMTLKQCNGRLMFQELTKTQPN